MIEVNPVHCSNFRAKNSFQSQRRGSKSDHYPDFIQIRNNNRIRKPNTQYSSTSVKKNRSFHISVIIIGLKRLIVVERSNFRNLLIHHSRSDENWTQINNPRRYLKFTIIYNIYLYINMISVLNNERILCSYRESGSLNHPYWCVIAFHERC